jgi:hypothetical protein
VLAAQAMTSIPVVVLSRGKRVWPHNQRGNLLESLWMEMQTELARQSPWSAHIVARDSGHQVHLDQPQLVAYAIAVLTDIHRSLHANDVDGEHLEQTDKAAIDFRAGTWLSDTLVDEPAVSGPVMMVSHGNR